MKISILCLLICFVVSGAEDKPFMVNFMPKCLSIDSVVHIIPGDTSDVVDTSYNDFSSIALPDSGIFISYSGDTLLLPAGVVISERKAALSVFYKSAWERQASELYYMKRLLAIYCEETKGAEALYQNEIIRLTKLTKRNWFERNAGYIGFGAALLVMAVRDYAVVDLMKK